LALSGAGSAQAHTLPYGYIACNWAWYLPQGDIKVGQKNLPANGSGDGVVNSFVDRAADATARIDAALVSNDGTGTGATWVGTQSGRNVIFESADIPTAGTLGQTEMPAACAVIHGALQSMPATVTITIDTRSDWFTQDDSRRAYWEGCPNSAYSATYTCQKIQDVGSTMLHELGHAVGLHHPLEVVSSGHGSNAFSLAKCSVVNDQATMCSAGDASGSGAYRTHRRTLDGWDTTSLHYQYNR